MTTVTVSTSAGLLSALSTAHAGDTILLASGTYSAININQFHFTGTVNITSASATSPAVINALDVNQSSGLHFSNLVFATTLYNAPTSGIAPTPFVVYSSSNISFDKISVHGTMDNNPQDDVNGMKIEGCSNVSITNSTFQQLFNAITELNNTNITIADNSIHDIRDDGIDNGGSSNVLITGNSFTNFDPAGAVLTTGDHSDCIQFWTSNTTADATNITVTNNTFVRGTGHWVQGIFMTDEVGLHYDNVTVTGNTIIGSAGNAITVQSGNNVNVSGNLVEGYADMPNFIRLLNDTGVTANNNIAPGFMLSDGLAPSNDTFISQLGNHITGVVAALTAPVNLTTPLTVVAETGSVAEHHTLAGNVLTGDKGGSLYLADIGVGAATQQVVAAAGITLTGAYGSLTVQADGTYSYVVTKTNLVAGQTYDDHFTTTIANHTGGVQSSTLDIIVSGSAVGNGAADTIFAGAGAQTISGFGGASSLTDGTGPDTFVFASLASSTPASQTVIHGFKAGDILDLSQVDPHFTIVSHFDHHANELVLYNQGNGNWEIYGDTTGSGTPNFQIHILSSTTPLSAADIHL